MSKMLSIKSKKNSFHTEDQLPRFEEFCKQTSNRKWSKSKVASKKMKNLELKNEKMYG